MRGACATDPGEMAEGYYVVQDGFLALAKEKGAAVERFEPVAMTADINWHLTASLIRGR